TFQVVHLVACGCGKGIRFRTRFDLGRLDKVLPRRPVIARLKKPPALEYAPPRCIIRPRTAPTNHEKYCKNRRTPCYSRHCPSPLIMHSSLQTPGCQRKAMSGHLSVGVVEC